MRQFPQELGGKPAQTTERRKDAAASLPEHGLWIKTETTGKCWNEDNEGVFSLSGNHERSKDSAVLSFWPCKMLRFGIGCMAAWYARHNTRLPSIRLWNLVARQGECPAVNIPAGDLELKKFIPLWCWFLFGSWLCFMPLGGRNGTWWRWACGPEHGAGHWMWNNFHVRVGVQECIAITKVGFYFPIWICLYLCWRCPRLGVPMQSQRTLSLLPWRTFLRGTFLLVFI